MSSNYPFNIDTFVNPSGSNFLSGPGGVTHADQHTNINDSMFALQTRVGVSGSNVPNTIDYELHNTSSGHNHNGINSAPAVLGTSGTISGSGYLTTLSLTTSIGEAVFGINTVLLDLSNSINNLAVSGAQIAVESQGNQLTPNAVRINLTGSGVSGSVTSSNSGDKVTYTIPGPDYRQILHLKGVGPFEHFTTPDMFHSCTYYNNIPILISASTWYTDISMSNKIFETIYKTRNNKRQATEIIYNVYNEDGITIKTQAVDIITYNGIVESSRLRSIV